MAADPSELYDALAAVYDDWQSADGAAPFSDVVLGKLEPELARFGAAGSPVTSLVDFGCGTGALLHHLRRRHPDWRLAGADACAAMLAVARGRPGADSIEWVDARLEQPLPPAALFDVAGCFYDTLNHLADTASLAAAMRTVAGSLRPGGLFVFDVTNEEGFERWWRGRRTWRGAGWRVAVEMAYHRERRESEARVTIDRGAARASAILVERCFAPDEWQTALAAAGLDLMEQTPWSPFPDDAPGKTWVIATNRHLP